jgi:hypothetical protein
MGLDTTHGCWSGAYSAFSRWRDKLADVAGYESVMAQYEHQTSETILIDWGLVTPARIMGDWDAIPCRIDGTPDPLLLLLAHSDCEGFIRSRFCEPLADRLAELLPLLPSQPDHGHIGDWQAKTQKFINGLREAAAAGEDVEFH